MVAALIGSVFMAIGRGSSSPVRARDAYVGGGIGAVASSDMRRVRMGPGEQQVRRNLISAAAAQEPMANSAIHLRQSRTTTLRRYAHGDNDRPAQIVFARCDERQRAILRHGAGTARARRAQRSQSR